jgi:hypothetical protein
MASSASLKPSIRRLRDELAERRRTLAAEWSIITEQRSNPLPSLSDLLAADEDRKAVPLHEASGLEQQHKPASATQEPG